jgi:integrase
LVVKFAYITGWRMTSEVLSREWRHVDLTAGTVFLLRGETKNKEPRTFYLTSARFTSRGNSARC